MLKFACSEAVEWMELAMPTTIAMGGVTTRRAHATKKVEPRKENAFAKVASGITDNAGREEVERF